MPKDTITKTIKTNRPITDSELIYAIKDAMGPIFEHFESTIKDCGGSATLHIELEASNGKVALRYGFAPVNCKDSEATDD